MKYNKHLHSNNKHFWTTPRLVLTAVVLFLIAMGSLSSCTSSDEKRSGVAPQSATPAAPAQTPAAPSATNEAPAALASLPATVLGTKLKTVAGSTITLGDYSGKVLLVNLWATWCGPCRNEIPELVKLHKEFQSQGVEMVGLSTEDPDSSSAAVKSFVQSFQMDYHVGWATHEVALSLMQLNQSGSIPQSFIISRDGHILKTFVGFNPVSTAPRIREAITEALNYKG